MMSKNQVPTAVNTSDFRTMDSLVVDHLDMVEEKSVNPSEITGVPTGLTDFDRMTCGLHPGDLAIVAALPGMGKTALAVTIAQHVALVEGLPVAFFSLQTGARQLVARFVSALGQIDLQHLHTVELTTDEWHCLSDAIERQQTELLHIDDSADITIHKLIAKARRLAKQHGALGLIVVDYLELIGSGARGNAARDITNIRVAKALKMLSRELKCPVVAFSELAPGADPRTNPRPRLSDIGDAYALLPYADILAFLHRCWHDIHGDNGQAEVAEIIMARQSFGPTGTVKVRFQPQFSRFETCAT